jgi:hypothetical protein
VCEWIEHIQRVAFECVSLGKVKLCAAEKNKGNCLGRL